MSVRRRLACVLQAVAVLTAEHWLPAVPSLFAQEQSPTTVNEWRELRWRNIGPHRGGRGKSAVGIPDQPNVFYIGFHNGGVWKTTDYGRTWVPLFDDQPSGSVGAIAIAPSKPDVIYVGSGEGLQRPDLTTGDGIYRSNDGGKTWEHFGLRDAQQIPQIVVDPRNPDRLFVAALGHPYGPNEERGIFRSTDGGRNFEKVLYKGPDIGAADVAFDPKNPDTVYATLWEARQGPWENGEFTGPGSGLFKSTDGGTTWNQAGRGLPTGEEGLGRIGIGICDSDPNRIYAVVASPARMGGLYHSSDAGASFTRVNADPRIWSREGDFHEVKPDPTNCDTVYVANVASWKSTDGGKTFVDFRGAPGGDDYQRIWINPKNPRIIIEIADQGAIVTVNGGETWSSWYNQPTAQFYHVNTDNAFPYRVCGGQQESGSACVDSRGNDGQITFREWHPVGVEEYGYAVPDPLNPDIVYGGKITRFDRRTGQVQNIAPKPLRGEGYRVVRTMPIAFSPVDKKTLFFASNTVWKTVNGGQSWAEISPDLSRETWEVPENVGKYRTTEAATVTRRGVIYALAPSPLDLGTLWAGTDDGLIHVTRDGGLHWSNVTPPDLKPWAKVSIMDASHFDANAAYAAINSFRLDDLRPHIYRTRDGGKTWTHIAQGIPDGGITNVIREDPKQRGLLFAGTEQAVYVSFNDGESWEALRLNMPATSIRDLVIKDDDLVVGTHGRSFWILDDITPLRQVAAARAAGASPARQAGMARFSPADPYLFAPAQAWRVRWNMNTDTPLPPDEPAGQNPPDGAIINYWLPSDASSVTLEIFDAGGKLVRTYESSQAAPGFSRAGEGASGLDPASLGAIAAPGNGEAIAVANNQYRPEDDYFAFGQAAPAPRGQGAWNFPRYWIRPAQELKAAHGFHRFVWDLHYAPPKALAFSHPIAATYLDTDAQPKGPWAMPGTYKVRLTIDGSVRREAPLRVKMDPRVKGPAAALEQQFALSMRLYNAIDQTYEEIVQLDPDAVARSRGFGAPQGTDRVSQLRQRLQQMLSLYDTIQEVDGAPTTQVVSAVRNLLR